MKIDVQISINEPAFQPDSKDTKLATAWVEIEDVIKFPVTVRKYIDKQGTPRSFVSYPQRKSKEGYAEIVCPADKEVRKEIEHCVQDAMLHQITKKVHTAPVTNIRITSLENVSSAMQIKNVGVASATVAGITINGIMIKEGKKGLFVEMPQHKTKEGWKDTIYATNSMMKWDIQNEILCAYQEKMDLSMQKEEKKLSAGSVVEERAGQLTQNVDHQDIGQSIETPPEQLESSLERPELAPEGSDTPPAELSQETEPLSVPEEPEPLSEEEAVALFLAAYENADTEGMEAVLESVPLQLSDPVYAADERMLTLQQADLKVNEYRISLAFQNEYDPGWIPKNQESRVNINIAVFVESSGSIVGRTDLASLSAYTPEEAVQAYGKVLAAWQKLTHQEFPAYEAPTVKEGVSHRQEEAAASPENKNRQPHL